MNTSDYLDKIILRKQGEVTLLLKETLEVHLQQVTKILERKHEPSLKFSEALKSGGLAVIGEIKRRSPSRGEISSIPDPAALGLSYCQAGVAAISVLTDTEGFGGSLNDLKDVKQGLSKRYPHVPLLRKDFIIHPIQLAEAVLAGASAVLLIVRVLGPSLKHLLNETKRLGLEALTEVHDLRDLETAIDAGASIIGVNHRNLQTFEMDLSISEKLRPQIPPNLIAVAESGIHTYDQAQRMHELGYDAVLVGEALVNSKARKEFISAMRGINHEN